jgi:hypothetical protein
MAPEENQLPRILLVDDQVDRHDLLVDVLKDRALVRVVHPLDVDLDDLTDIDLVSVDEFLGDDWELEITDTLTIPASLSNRDGLAVAASFRSQTRRSSDNPAVSTSPSGLPQFAVTLHTGALATLAGDLPSGNREALTANQHDLEWVFQREDEKFPARLAEMALASRSLLSADRVQDDFGASWLNVPSEPWRDTAIAQIEDCRPPAHSLARNTNGRSYLRWLAHRVLPYPAFLVSRDHGANLLGITARSFDALAQQLEGSVYAGPLSNFLGQRWWRAGLQQILVNCDVYQWDNAVDRARALSTAFGIDLDALQHDQPVVSYDIEGRVKNIDTDPETSVRLQQDGWPVWADDPWASKADVAENDLLRRMVAQADRPDLKGRP